MNRRLPWIVLLACACSLLLFFLSRPTDSATSDDLHGPARSLSAEPKARPEFGNSRVAIATEGDLATGIDLEPGESHVEENAAPKGKVIVLVEVALPANAPDALRRQFVGALVRTQSWEERTDVTRAHEAPIDEEGIARFEFEGAVHLDWFCLDSPLETGLAAAYAEMHIDLDPGSIYRHSLVPKSGVPVRGRVEHLEGGPIAGVEVALHLEDSWLKESGQVLAEWYPPLFTTQTANDGSFVFHAIPHGYWIAAVPPKRYVQIRPDPEGNWTRGCMFELTKDNLDGIVLSPFQVVPASPLRVKAIDASGEPAAGVVLKFRPLDLRSPLLFTNEQWKREQSERDSAGLPPRLHPKDAYEKGDPHGPWPYDEQSYETDAKGEALLGGIPGDWELVSMPRLSGKENAQRLNVSLPSQPLTLNIPGVLATVSGLVRSSTEAPLYYAEVTIAHADGEAHATTNRSGEFELAGLSMTGAYELEIEHHQHLPGMWARHVSDQPGEYTLRSAKDLRVRVLDSNAAPVRGYVQIIAGSPAPELHPLDEFDARWFDSFKNRRRGRSTDQRGRTRIPQLFPGSYRVALLLPVVEEGPGRWGRPKTKNKTWDEWTLEAGPKEHTLTTDLSGYVLPPKPVYVLHTGRVAHETTGEPLAGVVVQAHWQGQVRGASTKEDGSFRLNVPEGECSFRLHKSEFEVGQIASEFFSGAAAEHAWELRPSTPSPRTPSAIRGNSPSSPDTSRKTPQ